MATNNALNNTGPSLAVTGTCATTTFDTGVAAAKLQFGTSTIVASGSDSNIDIIITPKGTGATHFHSTDPIGITLNTPLAVPYGGTGVNLSSSPGVFIGNGTSAMTLIQGSRQKLLVGVTGSDPVEVGTQNNRHFYSDTSTLTTSIYLCNQWTTVTGASVTLEGGMNYILNRSSLVTATLPTTAVIGQQMIIAGLGSGGWRIAQNANQSISLGASVTTPGVSGRLDSTNAHDSLTLCCVSVNANSWCALEYIGTITVT